MPRPDLSPRAAERSAGEPDIRVRLAARQQVATLGGPRELNVKPLSEARLVRVLSSPVEFSLTDSSWMLTDGRRRRAVVPRTGFRGMDPLVVSAVGPAGITFGTSSYPGEFRLVPRRDGSSGEAGAWFDVVEHVPLERYLPGVVSRELFPNWSLEAYKAQAVAARTYALQERGRSLGEGSSFDVEASEQDQAYGGSTVNATALRAVSETRGLTLTWGGRLLRSYYSSCCGGRAGSAKDTWPTRAGFEYNLAEPIQGRPRGFECPCDSSKRYRWVVTRDKGELVARMAAYGREVNLAVRDLRSLSRITVASVNEAGRPASYRVFDSAGKWYPLSAEQLRLACNTAVAGGPGPVDAGTRVFSGDLNFTISGASVKIEGRGFGHGVGLCQYGAEGMARQGRGFMDILKAYYPGAAVEKAY